MMNPSSLAAGVAVGIASEQANKQIAHVIQEQADLHPTQEEFMHLSVDYLRLIAEALNPSLTKNLDLQVLLQPYPAGWKLPSHNRKHVSLFVPSLVTGSAGSYSRSITSVKLYFEIFGTGSHVATLSPGWTLLDLPPDTLISTADGNNYAVIISLRDDAIGTAI